MIPAVKRIVEDIKALKVQGARNIAKAALDAQRLVVRKSKAKTAGALLSEMKKVRKALEKARATEPALRNYMLLLFEKIGEAKPKNTKELKSLTIKTCDKIEQMGENAVKKIWTYGARKIPNKGTILVHCHSSTLVGALIKAWKSGKRFKVYSTETRPLFQGHKTSQDLAKAKIPVVQIVDSAAAAVMPKVDIVLVGCDAITAEGAVINKIGTRGIAIAAKFHGVPLYVCGETFKYDPATKWGYEEPIEIRDPKELGVKIRGVKAYNPSFDLTPPQLIAGIITEGGVIPPQEIGLHASAKA